MNAPPVEFSRIVLVARLGADPYRQQIAATEAEREALACRFDLVSLDHLSATVELARERGGTILLRAGFDAAFAQHCIVTLDPVAGSLHESFVLRYGPPEAEPDEAVSGADDEPAFEPLTGDAIDVGEAVAQEFSLALPPFPRAPDAVVEAGATEPDTDDGPFAALARLSRREGG